MILKNLWRRPTRSLLTILGIAIGVAAVVSMGAMAQGMLKNYGTVIGTSNDVLVIQANSYDPVFSTLDETLSQRLQTIPGVANVDPGAYTWIATNEMPFLLIFGYESGSVAMTHFRIVEGKPVIAPKQIVLGRRAADELKKGVDDTVRLYGTPYHVVGIYETGQGMEESGGVVLLADGQEIAQKPRRVSLFQVGLRRDADINQVMKRIESLDKALSVSKASEYNSAQQYGDMISGFAWGVAAIAVLVGGLGMMNAMVMSVLERTREIGTLRALGWPRRRVLGLIMGESLLISLVGGALGIAIGVGLTELAARAPLIGVMLGGGGYSIGIFAQGLITALCLGLIGGAYPAWRAANLQPVEALRYEGGAGQVSSRFGGRRTQRVSDGERRRLPFVSIPLRNLWRRRARTIISVTGIGIGVATLVMLGGMVKGLTDVLNGLAGSSGTGNISVIQAKTADMSLSAIDERVGGQIAAMPGVKSVSPMLWGFMSTPETPLFILEGLDPQSSAMSHYQLVEGQTISRPNEILLGKLAAKNFKKRVGDTLDLYNNRYRIAGIYETGVAWEDGGSILFLREAQRLLNRPRSVSMIFVNVQDVKEADAIAAAIQRRFPDVRASLSSEFAQKSDDMAYTDAMVQAIGLLALLVGGIVVANTMMMSIYERTREIGTLRALGWPQRRILVQVVQESLLLCLIAGFFGCVLGVFMMLGMMKLPFVEMYFQASWDPSIFVRSAGMALMVGLLAGLYPAWRASRLKPVEALRYE